MDLHALKVMSLDRLLFTMIRKDLYFNILESSIM